MKKPLYFHASSVGTLLVGASRTWTEKDETALQELDAREAGTFKTASGRKGDYTDKMLSTHTELREKRSKHDAIISTGGSSFVLGATARSYVEDVWRLLNLGFRRPVVTKEILKGIKCEQDSFDLISQVYPRSGFRMANKEIFRDEWFTGKPDVLLDDEDFAEDAKTVWDKQIFMGIDAADDLYYDQGQVYMHLTGRRRFIVHYCLVNTPPELIKREQRRFYWSLVDNGEDDNDDYRAVCEQIERNHNCDDIEPEDRIKSFAFDYDPERIEMLKLAVVAAREYYSTLKFNNVPKIVL